MKKLSETSVSEPSNIEDLIKIISGISREKILYYTIKSNLSTISDPKFLERLWEIINPNFLERLWEIINPKKLSYKKLYALLKVTIISFKEDKEKIKEELISVLWLKVNMGFDEIISFLKDYLNIKVAESTNLKIENKDLKKEIETLQNRNELLNSVLENILHQLEDLKELGINSVEDLKNKMLYLHKRVTKLERFINYLKNKKILLPTSWWWLKINPLIKEYLENLDKKMFSPSPKESSFSLNSGVNNIIKDKWEHRIEKFTLNSLDEKKPPKNKTGNTNLEYNLMEKEFLLEEKLNLEKKLEATERNVEKLKEENKNLKKENERLSEENKNLEKENEELKKQLESLKQQLNAYKNPLDIQA